jgi:hypothetical protein
MHQLLIRAPHRGASLGHRAGVSDTRRPGSAAQRVLRLEEARQPGGSNGKTLPGLRAAARGTDGDLRLCAQVSEDRLPKTHLDDGRRNATVDRHRNVYLWTAGRRYIYFTGAAPNWTGHRVDGVSSEARSPCVRSLMAAPKSISASAG